MAGRKSTAALSVVPAIAEARPQAPAGLPAAQKKIWERVVASEAAGMFRTAATQLLLVDYCRHCATGDWLSGQIERAITKADSAGEAPEGLSALLRMRDTEARAAVNKATKLRMTNQARYTTIGAQTALNRASKEHKPWQAQA